MTGGEDVDDDGGQVVPFDDWVRTLGIGDNGSSSYYDGDGGGGGGGGGGDYNDSLSYSEYYPLDFEYEGEAFDGEMPDLDPQVSNAGVTLGRIP